MASKRVGTAHVVCTPLLFIHKVLRLGCRLTTGTIVRHPVQLQPAAQCRFMFFEPNRLQPVLLIDRCEDAELLLLLLLIVVGLLMFVEELVECTLARVSCVGDVAFEVVEGVQVMIGTIVVEDFEADIEGLEDVRPEDVCGLVDCVEEADEFVADDGGEEKDAGRADTDVGRVALGRGPGLQANGETDFLYSVQNIAGMVEGVCGVCCCL